MKWHKDREAARKTCSENRRLGLHVQHESSSNVHLSGWFYLAKFQGAVFLAKKEKKIKWNIFDIFGRRRRRESGPTVVL